MGERSETGGAIPGGDDEIAPEVPEWPATEKKQPPVLPPKRRGEKVITGQIRGGVPALPRKPSATVDPTPRDDRHAPQKTTTPVDSDESTALEMPVVAPVLRPLPATPLSADGSAIADRDGSTTDLDRQDKPRAPQRPKHEVPRSGVPPAAPPNRPPPDNDKAVAAQLLKLREKAKVQGRRRDDMLSAWMAKDEKKWRGSGKRDKNFGLTYEELEVEIEDLRLELAQLREHSAVLEAGGAAAKELQEVLAKLEVQESVIAQMNVEVESAAKKQRKRERRKQLSKSMKSILDLTTKRNSGSGSGSELEAPRYSIDIADVLEAADHPPKLPPKRVDALASSVNLDDRWRIMSDDLIFGAELARGNFGCVFKGEYAGNICVIKQLLTASEKAMTELIHEAKQLSQLRTHASICTFYGVCLDPPLLVYEYIKGGNLRDMLDRTQKPLSGRDILSLVRDLASGMQVLHDSSQLHLDLATRNLLVMVHEQPLKLRIGDFGAARFVPDDGLQEVSTAGAFVAYRWLDPFAVQRKAFTKATDVWAFGVCIYEMVSRALPYADIKDPARVIPLVFGGFRLPQLIGPNVHIAQGTGDFLADLMSRCWRNPDERPSFREISQELRGWQAGDGDDVQEQNWSSPSSSDASVTSSRDGSGAASPIVAHSSQSSARGRASVTSFHGDELDGGDGDYGPMPALDILVAKQALNT